MIGSKEAYNNVEISSEEMDSLETTQSELTKDETQENSVQEQSVETPVVETSETEQEERATNPEVRGDFFEIDGERFNKETISQWKSDSSNKSEWNKSNTEKAQKIAKVGKFLNKVESDSDFKEHIRHYFDSDDEFDKMGLSENYSEFTESEETDEVNPYDERLDKLEEAEYERNIDTRTNQLDRELSRLESDNPEVLGAPDKVNEFLEFTEANSDRFRDKNGIVHLEEAYKVFSYDYYKEQNSHYKKLDKNRAKNSGVKVGQSKIGAKETVAPKKYNSWKDITADDPEIAKYFE
jgi:hypothetical protein